MRRHALNPHWNRTGTALLPHWKHAVLAVELQHEEFHPGRNVIQMSPVIISIAIPVALSGIAAIAFAVIVAGIRKADRSPLTSGPASRADAIARRVVGGVRYREESGAPARSEGPVSS
jgi:hypothetical protein